LTIINRKEGGGVEARTYSSLLSSIQDTGLCEVHSLGALAQFCLLLEVIEVYENVTPRLNEN